MNKSKTFDVFGSIVFIAWAIVSFLLIIVERKAGEASGGEFAIGIILWSYVVNSMSSSCMYLK